MCTGAKLNSPDIAKVKRSLVKVTRSNEIYEKNMKYISQTLSDNGNLLLLQEIEVAGANGEVRFLTGSS